MNDTKEKRDSNSILFNLFCLFVLFSQFNYILTFNIGFISLSPTQIMEIIIIMFDLKCNNFKLKYKKNNNPWYVMLFVWILWSFLSLVWAKDKMSTISVIRIFIQGFFFIYYAQRLIDSKEKLKRIFNMLFIALTIHIILCIIELKFGIYFFSIYTEKYSLRGYPVSTFTNTNNLACYLSIMIFFIMYAWSLNKSKKIKVWYLVLLIFSIYLNIKTASRGAVIAMILGLVVFIILSLKNAKSIIYFILVLMISAMIVLESPTLQKNISDIIFEAFSVDISAKSGSDFYRTNAYLNGLDFFKSSYGIGISPGNVGYWMENYGTRFTNNVKPLHNWWLEILVTSGVLITIMMIIVWFKTYKKLIKNYISSDKKEAIKSAALIAWGISFAIACIAPSSLYKMEWPWILLGLFFLISNNEKIVKK